MKKLMMVMFLVCSMMAVLPALSVAAEGRSTAKLDVAGDVLKEILLIPEKGIPPALLSNASGIAIIPDVIKAGFILGGRYGTGVLLVRDKEGRWSNPSYISITGGSIGWQIGVESIDIILVFKNEKSINRILTGKFTIGADASVAAGPVGRGGQAATDIELKSEIYSYSRSRGLFVGLSLEGAALLIDEESNAKVYGKEGILAREIFESEELKAPEAAERLRKMLTGYTDRDAEKKEKP
ncbi:MAG: lipid-binding SYLF domain-containing protein [Thermodesulfovibrionales bacterium]